MVNHIKAIGSRIGLLLTAMGVMVLGAFALAGPASATAADPVGDAFDDLQSKVTTYGAATVALVVASVVLFFGIKFLRRGASKA